MSVSEDGSVCSPESTIWAKAILLSPGMALRRRHINKDVLLPFWNGKHLAWPFFLTVRTALNSIYPSIDSLTANGLLALRC